MRAYVLPIAGLATWLDALRRSRVLIAPTRDADGIVSFRPVQDLDEIAADCLNPNEPAKTVFFPPSETLFRYEKLGARPPTIVAPQPDGQPFVLFGCRLCDAAALRSLDDLFLDGDGDPYYRARREASLVIAATCEEPGPECFCEAMGNLLSQPQGADVVLTRCGDRYLAQAWTGKGQAAIDEAAHAFREAADEDLKAQDDVVGQVVQQQRRPLIARIAEQVAQAFDDEGFWQRVSRACLSCGICSYLCPSCTCFDMMDDAIGDEGHRFRCWDSCQFEAFCVEASGHNPRADGWQRLRQRVAHKLWFSVERFGHVSCVGCGRCIRLCPVNIDISQIIEQLQDHGNA
jgi:ferredoxin